MERERADWRFDIAALRAGSARIMTNRASAQAQALARLRCPNRAGTPHHLAMKSSGAVTPDATWELSSCADRRSWTGGGTQSTARRMRDSRASLLPQGIAAQAAAPQARSPTPPRHSRPARRPPALQGSSLPGTIIRHLIRDRAVRLLALVEAPGRFERRRSGATLSIKSVRASKDKARRRMANRESGSGLWWNAPPSIQPTRGSTIPAPASTVSEQSPR